MEDYRTLMQQGVDALADNDLSKAQMAFRAVLQNLPEYDDALQLLGLTLFRQGKSAEAEKLMREAIGINPQSVRARNNLACMLRDLGRLEDASAEFQQLYLLTPEDPSVCSNLAIVLNDLGHTEDALRFSSEALALSPQWGQAHRVHGLVLKNLCQLDDALLSMNKALEIEPANPEFISNLSSIQLERKEYVEAELTAKRALELNSSLPCAHHNLGVALGRQFDFDLAISHLETAVSLNPGNANAFFDLAACLCDRGEYARPMELFHHALTLDPRLALARFGLGCLQLLLGDFTAGWANYEARKSAPQLKLRRAPKLAPNWNGEPIDGKRLFIYGEQGFGDSIQFVRFVPKLIEMGASVHLDVQPELISLITDTGWPIELVAETEAKYEQYDFECSLLSLPKALSLSVDDLPVTTRYLLAGNERAAYWQGKLVNLSQPRIGLCWAGNPAHKNDHRRSISTDQFSRFCIGCDAEFVSLQKDYYDHELDEFAANQVCLRNWADEFFNFSETAALIGCLDLVITVDTAIAHLAGALGKDVWILVDHAPDWRWLLNRPDSPWYPTMRIYRQDTLDDWDSVLSRVADDLAAFVEKSRGLTLPGGKRSLEERP